MVNFGFNTMTIFGLLDIIGGISYFVLIINQLLKAVKNSNDPVYIIIKILELLFCPIALFLSGIILMFSGWRLDIILQFQQLLLHIIVLVPLVKKIRSLT